MGILTAKKPPASSKKRTWARTIDLAVVVPDVDIGVHKRVIDADPSFRIDYQHLAQEITSLKMNGVKSVKSVQRGKSFSTSVELGLKEFR